MKEYAEIREHNLQTLFSLTKEGDLEGLKKNKLIYKDFFSKDIEGETILDWARRLQHQSILDYFFTYVLEGFEEKIVNYKDCNLLQWALLCNQIVIARKIIEENKCCDNYSVNKDRVHAIHVACSVLSESELIESLLKKNPELSNLKGLVDFSPLMCATKNKIIDKRGLVKLFVDNGCNLKQVNIADYNVMHRACMNGDISMVDILLELQPDLLESATQYKQTPLILAARAGNTMMVRHLAAKNANLNYQAGKIEFRSPNLFSIHDRTIMKGVTALHLSALNKDFEMVKTLIDCGASPFIDAYHAPKFTTLTADQLYNRLVSSYFCLDAIPAFIQLAQYIHTASVKLTQPEINKNSSNSFFLFSRKEDEINQDLLKAATVLKAVVLGHAEKSSLDEYVELLKMSQLNKIYMALKDHLPESTLEIKPKG